MKRVLTISMCLFLVNPNTFAQSRVDYVVNPQIEIGKAKKDQLIKEVDVLIASMKHAEDKMKSSVENNAGMIVKVSLASLSVLFSASALLGKWDTKTDWEFQILISFLNTVTTLINPWSRATNQYKETKLKYLTALLEMKERDISTSNPKLNLILLDISKQINQLDSAYLTNNEVDAVKIAEVTTSIGQIVSSGMLKFPVSPKAAHMVNIAVQLSGIATQVTSTVVKRKAYESMLNMRSEIEKLRTELNAVIIQ